MLEQNIHPFDWKSLKKGTFISSDQIHSFWEHHFPDQEWNDFSLLKVKTKLEELIWIAQQKEKK